MGARANLAIRPCRFIGILLCGAFASFSALHATEAGPELGAHSAGPCFPCHGSDGNSEQPLFPKLAGQRADFIVQEMEEFKDGRRSDPMMTGIAQTVSDQDIRRIAAYFASQPVMQGEPGDPERVQRGKTLFIDERCVFCHAEAGKSFVQLTGGPIIGGQHKDYLVKALKDMKEGRRSGDVYDLMARSLTRLSEDDIEAMAEYLSTR